MRFRGLGWTTNRVLEKLKGRRISSLELFGTSADDDLLIELSRQGRLTSLDISSDQITDRGVRAIVSSCNLRSLIFRHVPFVTDDSLRGVSACQTLRELYLDGTSVTDDGIPAIASLPELSSLDVSRTKVTDRGISKIASKQINLISFNESAITGVGFSTWSISDKMSFYTRKSLLNDDGFGVVCRMFSKMWNVVIENTRVTDVGLQALAGQSPTLIRMKGSKITREGVIWAIENTNVQSVEVDPGQFSEQEAEVYRDYQGRYLRISVYQ